MTDKNNGAINKRNFLGGIWHGAFLALGISLTQPTTVLSAFIAQLTGSTLWVGGLATVLTVASVIPQLFVAKWIEPYPKKKPFLLLAIYLRVFSWGLLSLLVFSIGADQPITLAWILVGMLVIFYAGGGLGNIPYTDIIGKVIPRERRGAFFGGKGAVAGPLSIAAALAARSLLEKVAYPNNYAILFGLAAAGLAVASVGFIIIKEPDTEIRNTTRLSWKNYWLQLRASAKQLKPLIIAQILTGFSLMVLPFYVVYAKDMLNAPASAVGWYLLAQISGGVLSNIVWAKIVDQSGSKRMLLVCALISTLTPILAITLGSFGWMYLLPVFFLLGAIVDGRGVGFQSSLLDIAPIEHRGIYAGLNAVLILPIAFLSLIAGWLLNYVSYSLLFAAAAAFIGTGAWVIYRWSKQVS
ncbi:MAG: hypothetical protein JW750_12400 [Anaerolineaceae bacterium]|nr:hypothetical protein [Anaerolineaceae bacterium]